MPLIVLPKRPSPTMSSDYEKLNDDSLCLEAKRIDVMNPNKENSPSMVATRALYSMTKVTTAQTRKDSSLSWDEEELKSNSERGQTVRRFLLNKGLSMSNLDDDCYSPEADSSSEADSIVRLFRKARSINDLDDIKELQDEDESEFTESHDKPTPIINALTRNSTVSSLTLIPKRDEDDSASFSFMPKRDDFDDDDDDDDDDDNDDDHIIRPVILNRRETFAKKKSVSEYIFRDHNSSQKMLKRKSVSARSIRDTGRKNKEEEEQQQRAQNFMTNIRGVLKKLEDDGRLLYQQRLFLRKMKKKESERRREFERREYERNSSKLFQSGEENNSSSVMLDDSKEGSRTRRRSLLISSIESFEKDGRQDANFLKGRAKKVKGGLANGKKKLNGNVSSGFSSMIKKLERQGKSHEEFLKKEKLVWRDAYGER